MAQKRMFSKKIVEKGEFLEMPLSTQALYFHLGMVADDEGVVDNVRPFMKMLGVNDDDIKILLAKQFLLPLENGVIVVRDWRIHNTLQQDRVEPSLYHNQLCTTYSIGENKEYTKNVSKMEEKCFQNVSIGKDSIDIVKNSIVKSSIVKSSSCYYIPSLEEVEDYCKSRNNNIDAQHFIDYYSARGWELKKGVKVKDWKACIRTWEKNDKNDLDKRYKEARIKEIENKTKNNLEKTMEISKRADEFAEKYLGGKNDKGTSKCISCDN